MKYAFVSIPALTALAVLTFLHERLPLKPGPQAAASSTVESVPVPEPTSIDPLPVVLARDSDDWRGLEESLRRSPEAALPILMNRYLQEKEPARKGLLAVLLAADPSMRALILEDFRAKGPGEWELFQGLALFALTVERGPGGKPIPWDTVVKMIDLAPKQLQLERRRKQGVWDFETQLLFDEVYGVRRFRVNGETVGTTSSRPSHDTDLLERVGRYADPEVRTVLLDAMDARWEWEWIDRIARRCLLFTAEHDRDFAADVAARFLREGDRDRVMKGLDILGRARLPAEWFPRIADLARRALQDRDQFREALWVLGRQKDSRIEAQLLELHSLTRELDTFRMSVLSAMVDQRNPAFEPIARLELASGYSANRSLALDLVASTNPDGSVDALVDALVGDPHEDVRRNALYLMVKADRWSPREEEALRAVARSSDPHESLRALARRLLAAEDRTADSAWDDLLGSE